MAALAAGLLSTSTACAGDRGVEIHRTAYGVPHILAKDLKGAAFGLAYAYASDNVCLLADQVLSVRGERSRFLGAEGRGMVVFDYVDNVSSDVFYRYYLNDRRVARDFARLSVEARGLLDAYRQGYNRYLADAGGDLPEACRGASWVRPLSRMDMYKLLADKSALASAGPLMAAILAAAPPGADKPVAATAAPPAERPDTALGSNGWAFSGQVTEGGRGLVMANPHYPWEGGNRFYQAHLTVPGQLDVMGAVIAPFPAVSIGFNRDVAWTHTVSAANRFTLFELDLVPGDPLAYRFDGKVRRIVPRRVRVEVKAAKGRLTTREHTVYESHFGPIVVHPAAGLGWSAGRAYALADGNRGNVDMLDAWLAINRAHSTREVRAALEAKRGLAWVNTLAADRAGGALYADIGRTPAVTAALREACMPSPAAAGLLAAAKLMVLNGARSACDWTGFPDPVLPASQQSAVEDAPYVANSNDSYWLVRPEGPSPVLSPIMGPTAIPQRLRTRIGLIELEKARAAGKLTPRGVQDILFANDNFAGRLALDATLRVCEAERFVVLEDGTRVDLAPACAALRRWDLRASNGSVGAPLFREFWMRAYTTPGLWATPFDPADPVHTPRDIAVDDPTVRMALRRALGEAVRLLAAQGFAPDITLGEVQVAVRNGERIPIPGGENMEGVLNLQTLRPLTREGYTPYDGASYIQIVGFDAEGPRAVGVLAYAQSVDPASPYFADQTRLYSAGTLYPLLFDWDAVRADPEHRVQPIAPRKKDAR